MTGFSNHDVVQGLQILRTNDYILPAINSAVHTLPTQCSHTAPCALRRRGCATIELPEDQHTMHHQHTSAFGAQLRRYREAAGLTQEQLAERAGLTANAISLLERGQRRLPYPQTIRKLAEALGLSTAEIATWRDTFKERELEP